MTTQSDKQRRLMEAASHPAGGYGGIPQKVAQKFLAGSPGSLGRPVTQAAGVFFNYNGTVLLCRRSGAGDFGGTWCIPGGGLEGTETPEEAVIRECNEELGTYPEGELVFVTRQVNTVAGVDYFTYVQAVSEQFQPVLNDEHTGYAWVTYDEAMKLDLHPGVLLALRRLTADETEIAEMIVSGELSSPQQIENFWLYDLRITGTGMAYRTKLKEYTWRDPTLYSTDKFLKRCNGLPVVYVHCEGPSLTAKEYKETNVGSIVYPYHKGDEVWGIARIYDPEVVEALQDEQMSTSPGIMFSDMSVNLKIAQDDGATLLIEGKPSLLDHLAICKQGVWDKGGSPAGVNATTVFYGDTDMDPEEIKKLVQDAVKSAIPSVVAAVAESRKDAEADFRASMTSGLSDLTALAKANQARLDSIEADNEDYSKMDEADVDAMEDGPRKDAAKKFFKARRDAEEEKAKKDATEAEEKAKKDAAEQARKDAESDGAINEETRKRLEALERNQNISDDDHRQFAEIQARADSVCAAFSLQASRPLAGEAMIAYRKRLLTPFKKYSADYKDIDVGAIHDSAMLDIVEKRIYADAMQAALHPTDLPAHVLREVKTRDATGRQISNFVGQSPGTWMRPFMSTKRRVSSFKND